MPQRLDPLRRGTALERLGVAALEDRLPQSLLLVGPEGSGKEAAALELARRVLCERAGDGGCPGESAPCPSCRKVAQLGHPDLMLSFPVEASLSPAGYRELLEAKAVEPLGRVRQPGSAIIPIGSQDDPGPVSVRAIRRFVGVKPFEGRRRVVIVGDAHRMNRAAANALLKTLEEPPRAALLLLCTHQPHLLPATVRSRCARVHVPALDEETLADHLQVAHGLEAVEAARAAAVAGGNARRALDLVDPQAQEIAGWATALLEMLAAGEGAALLKGAELVSKGQNPRGGRGSARGGRGKGGDASLSAARDVGMRVLDYLVADLLVLAKLETGARVNPVHAERLQPLRGVFSAGGAARLAHRCLQARGDLGRNVNVGLVLTQLFHETLLSAGAEQG